jgi:hypothetical protein
MFVYLKGNLRSMFTESYKLVIRQYRDMAARLSLNIPHTNNIQGRKDSLKSTYVMFTIKTIIYVIKLVNSITKYTPFSVTLLNSSPNLT